MFNLLIYYYLSAVLDPIIKLIPRNSNIWVFGDGGGRRFADNSKYLFLYVSEQNCSNIKPIWLSRDPKIVRTLQSKGYLAFHSFSLRGIYYNLKAKYVFLTNGLEDVNPLCISGSCIIRLWHGTPLKKVACDVLVYPSRFLLINKLYKNAIYKIYRNDYVLSSSKLISSVHAKAFRINEQRCLSFGYPRNDAIFREFKGFEIGTNKKFYDAIKTLYETNSLILYMPTWRDQGGNPIIDGKFDLVALNQKFGELGAYLLCKFHPYSGIDYEESKYERIIFLPFEFDVYPVLAYINALVTDYSSIYFDYLLLNRPIIFFPYDLDQYLAHRDLYFDYHLYTPGPKVTIFEDLLSEISSIINGVDNYQRQRDEVRELCMSGCEGEACERIYQFIKEISLNHLSKDVVNAGE